MNNQFPEKMKKLLIFTDTPPGRDILAVLHSLSAQKKQVDIFVQKGLDVSDFAASIQPGCGLQSTVSLAAFSLEINDVSLILNKQLIGTHLYATGSWRMIHFLQEAADRAGFDEEEIQANPIGKEEEQVFCIKCYSLNERKPTLARCSSCNTKLEISNHYSKRLNAYLGYIQVG